MADATVSVAPARHAGRASRRAKRIALYLIALGVLCVVLVPLAFSWLGGFRDNRQLASTPVGLPDPWVTENYRSILGMGTFWRQV